MLFHYLLHLADTALILGQRLGEWCGHGPVLEQDMAMTNISLDLVGQATFLYQYAAEMEGQGRSEDDLAFLRDGVDYRNLLLVEQPNGDFACTVARQFFFDSFQFLNYSELLESKDERLAAFAEKSLKEIAYHRRWSSDWILRLGDGTTISHQKIQKAIDDLWMWTGEMFVPTDWEMELSAQGIAADVASLRPAWEERVAAILAEATLEMPKGTWMQSGGKNGRHSEHFGFILTEMQWMQRAYPGQVW